MKETPGLFEAVILASASLHVALVLELPKSRPTPAASAPSFVEVGELPQLAAPVPAPQEEPAPAPTPRIAARAIPMAATAPTHPREESAAMSVASDLPVDFTSTVLSSADGPGVAIPSAPAARATTTTSSAGAPARATAVGPQFVEAANLSKAPRAPPLDTLLEKNYPREARRSGISGSAVLRIQILPDGRIGVVRRVSETYSGFGEACERTVKTALWEPPIDRGGKPVATEITYTCRFEVRG